MTRRVFVARSLAAVLALSSAGVPAQTQGSGRMRGFMNRAFEMRRLAIAAGDEPYGAVIVVDNLIVAESPSRVVASANPDAHAEREAIRMAQQRLGTRELPGAILVSTARACPLCERAAYEAHILRMVYGEALVDAGPPRG